MSKSEACCTCATLLTDTKVPYDPESEKPLVLDRRLTCCHRTICATCQYRNPRFQTYCPFCQISSEPGALPTTGLRLPPSYTSTAGESSIQKSGIELPPSYDSATRQISGVNGAPPVDTEDTVHFLSAQDSFQGLSLAYKVPVSIIRQHNNIYSDTLLAARKWVLIPRSHYSGPSLSTPPDPQEEERKNKLRRWMVATKCADYNVAILYLNGSAYDLDIAIDAYREDEQWEKNNPLNGKGKGNVKYRRHQQSGSLSGQL